MKLKSKIRIKFYNNGLNGACFYNVECQNTDGYWISFVKCVNSVLAANIRDLIKKNPNLIIGQGYLFDIEEL